MKVLGKATSRMVTGYLNTTCVGLKITHRWSREDHKFKTLHWFGDTNYGYEVSQGAFEYLESLLLDTTKETATLLVIEEDNGEIITYMAQGD